MSLVSTLLPALLLPLLVGGRETRVTEDFIRTTVIDFNVPASSQGEAGETGCSPFPRGEPQRLVREPEFSRLVMRELPPR